MAWWRRGYDTACCLSSPSLNLVAGDELQAQHNPGKFESWESYLKC